MRNQFSLVKNFFAASCILLALSSAGQTVQKVEGFDTVVFHYNANRSWPRNDFRGYTAGYMTAGWWSQTEMKDNKLSWRTAIVPEKKATTFYFIGSSAVVPSEFSRGPKLKLFVNGNYALTFNIGLMRNYTWKEGDYELKYISKREEYPYANSQREFELSGNSGIYQLTVPASAVEAGKPAVIEVEMQFFERWHNGWFMVKKYKDVLGAPTIASLSSEIAVLRKDVNLLNQQTQLLATQVYSDMLGRSDFKHEIIYANGYKHEHPADMIKLKNGDILLFTREATEHFANDGDIVMVRSRDGGKTWGGRQVVSAIKDLDEREGCGIQLKDGTILLGIFYNDLYKADGLYNWNGQEKLPALKRPRLGTHFIRSKDNGKTWQELGFIDLKGMPFTGIEGPTDAPVLLPDGSMVMGVIPYGRTGDPKDNGAVLLRSTDEGNSWKYVSTIGHDPGGKLGGLAEPGLVLTKTGRLIAGLRNGGENEAIYMTYSDDYGKTWVPYWKTEMIGHPVDLIQLNDGRIMATYGIRNDRHAQPGGIRACFSNDNGKTWDISTEVQIRNDFLNWDVGYPESLQLPDGKILTVYYFNLFQKYFIGGTFWKPDAKRSE